MKFALFCSAVICAQTAVGLEQQADAPTAPIQLESTFQLDNESTLATADDGSEVQLVGCEKSGPCKCNKCSCFGYSRSGGCGKCFNWGNDFSLSVGAGIRASYNSIEGANPANDGRKQDFNINNARLYFNGQGHERIGFEFNVDVNNAQNFDLHQTNGFGSQDEGELRVLDAILKLQLTDTLHVWMGRFLPPSDRSNLDGPFYLNAWNFPFAQIGYPNIFQGRDDGVSLWGEYGGGAFKWQIGAFEGESAGGTNFVGQPGTDNLMFTARVTLNLLDPEPGYYNASTYYGEKDILAIAAAVMHRSDALQNSAGSGAVDYTGWNIDALYETKLCNCGVITFEGAYYDFNDNDGFIPGNGPVTLPPSFGPRQGNSYFVLSSYLFPKQHCFLNVKGNFQVLGRYQSYDRDMVGQTAGGVDDQTDLQLSYIMFGHNARISAVWSQLDTPGAENSDTFTIGSQFQF